MKLKLKLKKQNQKQKTPGMARRMEKRFQLGDDNGNLASMGGFFLKIFASGKGGGGGGGVGWLVGGWVGVGVCNVHAVYRYDRIQC